MATTYYKLARFEERFMTFRDGKTAYPTEAGAFKAAEKQGAGTYRISRVSPDEKRVDGMAFDLEGPTATITRTYKQYPAHATRPMGGRPH